MKLRKNHPERLWGSAWCFPAFVLLLFVSMAFLPSADRNEGEKELQTAFTLCCMERATIDFNVTELGVITAEAEWLPAESPAALILYGPGQMNYYVRKDGKSPHKLEFTVTEKYLARGTEWSIVVLNQEQDAKISGMLKVRFPGEAPKSF